MPENPQAEDRAGAPGGPSPGPGGAWCDGCHLIEEAEHRIANHLAMLAAFVRLKDLEVARDPAAPSAEAVHMLLETIRTQTDAVAGLHRSLASNRRHASADLAEHLHATCAPLATLLAGRADLVEDFAPGCEIAPDQVLPITQIVAEAITNAVKHAYPPGRRGAILVRSHRDQLGAVVVQIVDDGPGLPSALDPREEGGLGLRLMRALSQQLGARLDFSSRNPGARVQLTLPAKAARDA